MMNQDNVFLGKIRELFFKYGVRSVTMDDIARELGISKKTLYQFVSNKSELINKALVLHFEEEKESVAVSIAEAQNAIEEIILIARKTIRQFKKMHPSSMFDIQKYYPESWEIIQNFKVDFIVKIIQNNLKRGVEEGLYRSDLNIPVISKFYQNMIDFLVNPNSFPAMQYQLSDLYTEFIKYHLNAITSDRGNKILKNIELIKND